MKKLKFLKTDETLERLDLFLARQQEAVSRSRMQKLIKAGKVSVAGKICTSSHHLIKTGDEIIVQMTQAKKSMSGKKLPLEILFEDEAIIIIDKPAGLTTHPAHEHDTQDTLVHALLNHTKKLSDYGGKLKPGIVHRLDKDTSGVMVIAKTNQAHKNLTAQIASRKVTKIYTALVAGHLSPQKGAIEAPIQRDQSSRVKMAVSSSKTAKYALTHYEVKKYLPDCSLLEVKIITGRTHQIRVHCASIGFPVIGDQKYGNSKINRQFEARFGLTRQFLHASKISFLHPVSGKQVEFEAELPEELKGVVEKERV